ncbi:butyrophilin subfamily 1 member A1-like [Acipenser ruthenus]|uniref:butyrophilin subfamily 1 member A1-like n=1 Tax=Acipenser ruthenus TaxID=7906 RepID=UPI0027414A3B|nr:butyrophilin subfamily 1 member A1-like [Acipenser ruthenus]
MRFLGRTCLIFLTLLPAVSTQTALGTQPSISMDSTQGEQTRLVCRSEGWSPEPEVIWRDRDGNDVTSLSSTTLLRDSQGLLSVSSYIKIKQQSNVFSCLVRSKIAKPDWESKLHISRDFFPGVSGWMVAFFLTLALSIGAIPLLVIQWRRMDAMERLFEPTAALYLYQHLRKELESVKREVLKSEWKWILSSAGMCLFNGFLSQWRVKEQQCGCFID